MTGLGIALGLVSYLLANVGMGVQKQGAPALTRLPGALGPGPDRRLLLTWALGTAMTVSASLLLFVALALGPVSIIATFEGVGLAALALYAVGVLGETLSRRDGVALGLIVVGTGLAGWAGAGGEPAGAPVGDVGWVLGSVAALTGVALCGAWVAWPRRRGLSAAVGAGVLAGLAMVVQKIVGSALAGGAPVDAVVGPAAVFLLLAGGAFVLTQLAYLKGRALDVVPAYASATMVVPVACAPAAFGEPVGLVTAVALAVLVVGVGVLARGSPIAALRR